MIDRDGEPIGLNGDVGVDRFTRESRIRDGCRVH